jgi:hypothetical protein
MKMHAQQKILFSFEIQFPQTLADGWTDTHGMIMHDLNCNQGELRRIIGEVGVPISRDGWLRMREGIELWYPRRHTIENGKRFNFPLTAPRHVLPPNAVSLQKTHSNYFDFLRPTESRHRM